MGFSEAPPQQDPWVDGEFVLRPPRPPLRGLVARLQGYRMTPGRMVWRRELPGSVVPLVLTFAGRFQLGPSGGAAPAQDTALVAGLQGHTVDTRWPAHVCGMQVDFTPPGARVFLGVPLEELTGRVVALEEVLGSAARRLTEQLSQLPSWEARFTLVEEAVTARLARTSPPAPGLTRAWQRIHTTDGRAGVQWLADELGYSRQQLATQFRQSFGMPPKAVARIRRFEHAVRLLEAGSLPLADIADRCGYFDQAHFNRDFRRLAGSSPRQHLALRAGEPGGDGASPFRDNDSADA